MMEMRIMDHDVDDRDGDDRVLEWDAGLPNIDDLTPLSQSLVPPELASAFSMTPEPHRSMFDVNRASEITLSNLRRQSVKQPMVTFNDFKSFGEFKGDEPVIEGEETTDLTRDGSDSRKLRRDIAGVVEEADSTRTSKRPRLVWTPQLHKRFVDVVAHLGVKNAVPKTIMQLMNVEGLTRENVASHLQKYRLYLKRMQGLSNEVPSSSDHLFASTPVPQSLHQSSAVENGTSHAPVPVSVPMSYQQQIMPMSMSYPPLQQMAPHSAGSGAYHKGLESHLHSYNMMMQQRDWFGCKFVPYQHHTNDK